MSEAASAILRDALSREESEVFAVRITPNTKARGLVALTKPTQSKDRFQGRVSRFMVTAA